MSSSGPLHVLVLDPSPHVLERLVEAVAGASRGLVVVAAASVAEAHQALESRVFRVAVVDAEAEGSAGLALAATVRRRWPATAVVLLVGVPEEELLARARRLGVQAVVEKADTAAVGAAVRRLAEPAPTA